MSQSEVHAVPLEKPDLLVRQHDGLFLAGLLESKQPAMPRFEVLTLPDSSDATRSDIEALKTKLVRDPLSPVRRLFQAELQDLLLDLRRNAVGVRSARTSLVCHKRRHASHLEGTTDLVKRIAVIAHELAGPRDVLKFFGQRQQRELPLDTLGWGGQLRDHFSQSTPRSERIFEARVKKRVSRFDGART
jgi:hypothetical protein